MVETGRYVADRRLCGRLWVKWELGRFGEGRRSTGRKERGVDETSAASLARQVLPGTGIVSAVIGTRSQR